MKEIKHGYIVIDGISFPTTEVNGMTMVDYPHELAPKITEEGRKNMEKLTALFKEMKEKYKFEVVYSPVE